MTDNITLPEKSRVLRDHLSYNTTIIENEVEAYARAAILADRARNAPAQGMVMVPREFLSGFSTLAHNWSMKAEAPCYYHGVERDAFAAAYRECGQALAKLRIVLLAASPGAASGAGKEGEL